MGRATGNNARRRAAADAAMPRWTVIDGGQLYLAPSGFSMHSPGGLYNWDYASVDCADMVAPQCVHFQGLSTQGPVSWILSSVWAELMFVSWALRLHRQHPQLVGGGWLPLDWLQRCETFGYRTRLATAVLLPSNVGSPAVR
jgi:hypothetical protein